MIRGGALALVLTGLTLVTGVVRSADTVDPNATVATTTPETVQPAASDTAVASSLPPTDSAPANLPPSEPPARPEAKLSKPAAEIVSLAQSGVGEDVMLAYVGTVNSQFNLGSDQIIYLNDLGVSGAVVRAMIQRDGQIAAASAAATASLVAPTPPPAPTFLPPSSNLDTPNVDTATAPPPPMDNSDTTNPPYGPGDVATSTDDSDYFYNSLAPYGSWVYTSGVGLCWQPTVCRVNREWRPYSDRGRWVDSDCGWYWQSDYSWGWAAFHYGRWFNDANRGWVWAPNRVWGPAWVSWRHGDEYCGWAPLPPAARFLPGTGFIYGNHAVGAGFEFGLSANQYTYIPVARMSDYAPARYAVPDWQNGEVHHRTVVANHFEIENHRVVNHSIDPREVAAASGTEIRRAEIREMPRDTGRSPQPDRLAKSGNGFVIFRPQLPPPAARHTGGNAGQPRNSSNQPRSSLPLPNMNLASHPPVGTVLGQGNARPENYPAGSLVVIGKRNPGVAPAAAAPLPNMKLPHVASSAEAQPYQPNPAEPTVNQGQGVYYAGRGPVPALDASRPAAGFNFNNNFDRSHFTPQAPSVQNQNQAYVIPAHYSVNQQMNAYVQHNVNETATHYSPQNADAPALASTPEPAQNRQGRNDWRGESRAESPRVESHNEPRADVGHAMQAAAVAHAAPAQTAPSAPAPAPAPAQAASSHSSSGSGSGKR
jgi:hypothetical protein